MILDIEQIKKSELVGSPWPHLFSDSFICSSALPELISSFPQRKFKYFIQHLLAKERNDTARADQFRIKTRPFLPMGECSVVDGDDLPEVWHTLAQEISGSLYREALSDATKMDLRQVPARTDFWRYEPCSFFKPHVDKRHKIVTHILYFGASTEHVGGEFRVLSGPSDKTSTRALPPTAGNSVLFPYHPEGWHSVSKLNPDATSDRCCLQTWFWREA